MNFTPRHFALVLGMGAVAAAIASAPGAVAAGTTTTQGPATTTERPGHVSIHVAPSPVTPPRVWGPFSSPLFLLGD
jgi:hypothetical protein